MQGDGQAELYSGLQAAGLSPEPVTIAHLGQSLDGFIATSSGDSRYVNGRGNLLHLHRMRALCDAVIVGAGTIAADDPQLTTRLVPGPNPVRVVLDPQRRLESHYRVFNDRAAPTLLVCRQSLASRAHGTAEILGLAERSDGLGLDLEALLQAMHRRGLRRIFVEGGGRTVSTFLAAGLLDRLQLTIAPLIIGEGRPGIRLPAPDRLHDCRRPVLRAFRMGTDILFDCDVRALPAHGGNGASEESQEPPLVRVL